jgi:hypothetical protein
VCSEANARTESGLLMSTRERTSCSQSIMRTNRRRCGQILSEITSAVTGDLFQLRGQLPTLERERRDTREREEMRQRERKRREEEHIHTHTHTHSHTHMHLHTHIHNPLSYTQ